MIKVLHVVEAFTGGVLTYLEGLVNGSDDEFEYYILYARRSETPADVESRFKRGVHLIPSRYLTRSIAPGKDLGAFFEIRKVRGDVKPDIVHLHSSKAGVLGRWALNGRKTPVFYTPNGYSFLMDDCSALKKAVYRLLEKISGLRHSTTIACGKGEYEMSRKIARRATYVNNGVDTDALDPCFAAEGTDGGFSICTLSRATRQKNPELFNQIAARLPDVKFVWIGDGELRGTLTSPNITITGWLPKQEALKLLMESEAFILLSLWEGLPLSLLEAMYLKRACVVSDIPGNNDVVVDGENGYICHDVDEYVRVIRRLSTEGVAPAIVENAHTTVRDGYSQRVMAQRYGEIYREAYGKRLRGNDVRALNV